MKTAFSLTLALYLIVFLSSCSSHTETVVALATIKAITTSGLNTPNPATVKPTVNPALTIAPSPTITISPTLPVSFTPTITRNSILAQSTATHAPSSTPDNTKAAAISMRVTERAYSSQTAVAQKTQFAIFSSKCEYPNTNSITISPDENWIVISCRYTKDQTLELTHKDGKQWVLFVQDYVEPHILNGWLFPIRWTADSRYLYFASSTGNDGGGFCYYGHGNEGLYRVDVNTGFVSPVLPKGHWVTYLFKFSPDGSKLAYYTHAQWHTDPVILDMITGQEAAFYSDDADVGDFTWSPDSSKLAFATCQIAFDKGNNIGEGKSNIQIYSLNTRKWETVYEVNGRVIHIGGLHDIDVTDNQVDIVDYEYETKLEKHYIYDWIEGKIIALKIFDWNIHEWVTSAVPPTPTR